MFVHRALCFYVVALIPVVLPQATFNPQNVAQGSSSNPSAVSLDISTLFNNRGFAMSPGDANFDGIGSKSVPMSMFRGPSSCIHGSTCPAQE